MGGAHNAAPRGHPPVSHRAPNRRSALLSMTADCPRTRSFKLAPTRPHAVPGQATLANTLLPTTSSTRHRTGGHERRSCVITWLVPTSGLSRHQLTGQSQPEVVTEVSSRVVVANPGEWRRLRQRRHVTGRI